MIGNAFMTRHGTLLLCLAMTFGCKPRNPNASEAKADFVDNAPTGGQNWTQARTISLNEYAADLLKYDGNEANKLNELQLQVDESLRIVGVEGAEPLSVYKISLGGEGECFSDDGFDIYWNSYRDQMKKQVEEVAYFVKDFHYAMLGVNKGAFSFKEVVICPEEKLGTKMLLEGYKLMVGIPSNWRAYKPLTNRGAGGLRELWESGAPLGLDDPKKGWFAALGGLFSQEAKAKIAMRAMWKLFNPLSPVRQGIRKTLHEGMGDLAERVLQGILPEQGGLGLTDDPELQKNLLCFAKSAKMRANLEDAAVSVMKREIRSETNDIQKDVKAGLVAVVNHHRVGVRVEASASRYAQFIGVERSTRDTKIKTKVEAGLVAVDTSDDISVDLGLALDLGKTADAAALYEAQLAVQNGRSLCP